MATKNKKVATVKVRFNDLSATGKVECIALDTKPLEKIDFPAEFRSIRERGSETVIWLPAGSVHKLESEDFEVEIFHNEAQSNPSLRYEVLLKRPELTKELAASRLAEAKKRARSAPATRSTNGGFGFV